MDVSRGFMRCLANFLFVVVFLISCIESVDILSDEDLEVLSVEGFISTAAETQRVRITRTSRYGDIYVGLIKPERGARVVIRDNLGNTSILQETPSRIAYYECTQTAGCFFTGFQDVYEGYYETTDGYKGEIGRSYVLQIITSEGKLYSSLPETIRRVPEIDSLSVHSVTLATTNQFIDRKGLEIRSHFKDFEEDDYYYWTSNGIFEIKTFPELFRPRFSSVPVPKPCCSECWKTEKADRSVRIYDDRLTNGNYTVVPVAFIEDDGIRLMEKYLLRIYQHSISKEAYQFYRLVDQQSKIAGSIFDPPPATVRGNVISLDNPDELVIGYFFASDMKKDLIFMDRSLHDNPKSITRIYDDCRVLRNAFNVKPAYW